MSVKRIHEASKESFQSVCTVWCKIGIGFTFPVARCEGLTQKGSFGLGVLSTVQQLLFVWGQSLCQSLFLISALQGGDSASDAKLWRIWSFCGEGCSETSVSVPCFLSCWYISSTDLAKDPCPSKTGGREPGDQKSQLDWGFFLSALIFLVAAVWEPSTGTLSFIQSCSGSGGCSSFHVPPPVPVQVDLASWGWLCAHV